MTQTIEEIIEATRLASADPKSFNHTSDCCHADCDEDDQEYHDCDLDCPNECRTI